MHQPLHAFRVQWSNTQNRVTPSVSLFSRGLFVLLIMFILSCGSQGGATEVEQAYNRFSIALLSNQPEVLDQMAPFLRDKKNEHALERLRQILEGRPSFKVRMLDERNAEVILSDPSSFVIPFTKNPAGEWMVADRIVRTRYIEFIPAK